MLTPRRFGGYFIKIQNKITKLFKHTSFILRNMDVKKQSEEDKKKMIFQKCPRKSVDHNFKIDNEHIKIVQQYAYLGTRSTPTGNF